MIPMWMRVLSVHVHRSIGASTINLASDPKPSKHHHKDPSIHSNNSSAPPSSRNSRQPLGSNSKAATASGKEDEGPSHLSTELKQELFRFCVKHGIPTLSESAKAISEHDCVQILRAASKMLQAPASGAARGGASAAGNEANVDVSDAGLKIRELERELRLALGAAEDIRALKAKVVQMIDRTRYEKELKLKAEADLVAVKKKMEIVADHMEKLMSNLKHEATAKIRSLEQLRVSEKNVSIWKGECWVEIDIVRLPY
jgi:hypothetical protein